jgi:hypothetical protein
MADRTLYASSDRTRFFHVPNEARLPPGDFVVRSLTGRKLEVDPVVLAVYEVPEAEAMALAQEVLAGFADKVRTVAMSAAKAITAPPKLDPAVVAAREQRIADALKIDRDTLRQDPAALGGALKAALQGLVDTARETVHTPDVAREKMKDVAEAFRQEGLDPGAADVIEGLPDRLRELLASDETAARLDAAARDLRKAVDELRAEIADRPGDPERDN